MRLEKREFLSCLLVVSLSMVLGCGKKDNGGTTPGPAEPGTQAASVDTAKPISEIQAQAETMSVDSLRATALKYKEAILAKQDDIEKMTAKIKEIPVAEALGQEATSLKTDLENLQTSLKALKDRFQVYYDTLKQKGGDLSGLTV